MSFRRRLTLFFVLIVIVPMVAVAVVLFRLISDNEDGKANARLAAEQTVAINMYQDARDRAGQALERIASDEQLAAALQDDDIAAARDRAQRLLASAGARRIVLVRDGTAQIDVGAKTAIAPATRQLVDAQRSRHFGELQVSVQDAPTYAAAVRRTTGADGIVVWIDGTRVASTLQEAPPGPLGRSGDVSVGASDFRYATFGAPGMLGTRIRVSVLAPRAESSSEVARSRIFAGGILAGFFVLAVTFALAVSRSLRGQVMELLGAARRLGGGDFSARVPTTGGDEFAALGEEFNKMARQLEERLADLAQERERVQNSMRRLGQAVGSNLDRDALLQLVVQTAVEGVGGEAGRATVRPRRDAPLEERVRVGGVNGLTEALREAEARALRSGKAEEAEVGEGCAIAHPLNGSETRDGVVGLVSVGRTGRAFTAGERDLFHYLATQAGVSMENVGLHETVARESVTDELTGLFNRRRFDEVLDTEVERAKRFGQSMALVLLDIDDFKQVNDTYGHQQGDVVLREVARVLRESVREIDEPARYGGEELAVVLPGTDLHGAYLLAERVRQGVEALRMPLMVAEGEIQITASLGVAALPESADDQDGLVAAADAAMYDAKRAGKNRAMRAQRDPSL
jgi:diguanylate cyclase (GGDEF)-like protein